MYLSVQSEITKKEEKKHKGAWSDKKKKRKNKGGAFGSEYTGYTQWSANEALVWCLKTL
jgi:hypothetical protein